MNSLPRISEAEWDVMQIIWDTPSVGAAEIARRLDEHRDWSHRTIRTMLTRLVEKGALTYREEGNRYLYQASVTRQSYVDAQSRSFLEKLFCGDAASMLLHFVENEKLSQADIKRLRDVLDQQDRPE